jgi:hypothetical protein
MGGYVNFGYIRADGRILYTHKYSALYLASGVGCYLRDAPTYFRVWYLSVGVVSLYLRGERWIVSTISCLCFCYRTEPSPQRYSR